MRITSTAKSFLLLLLFMTGLVAFVFYLIFYQPRLGYIIYYVLGGIAGLFLLYVIIAPLKIYLSEQASNVMAMYTDASGKGLHVFSSFQVSRVKVGLSPLRSIQYYFFVTATGKNYYKVLFTHDMASLSGRSGYRSEEHTSELQSQR